jgi:hypothetical protein
MRKFSFGHFRSKENRRVLIRIPGEILAGLNLVAIENLSFSMLTFNSADFQFTFCFSSQKFHGRSVNIRHHIIHQRLTAKQNQRDIKMKYIVSGFFLFQFDARLK